jgi:CubicO group peptidase (beta-lactamase class C family)
MTQTRTQTRTRTRTQSGAQIAQPELAPEVAPAAGALPPAAPEELGLDPDRLEQLFALIEGHIAAGRYPGAQVAVARHGRLAAFRTFGRAQVDPDVAATDATLLREERPVALDEARSAAFRAAGVPGGGGYGTAAALA